MIPTIIITILLIALAGACLSWRASATFADDLGKENRRLLAENIRLNGALDEARRLQPAATKPVIATATTTRKRRSSARGRW